MNILGAFPHISVFVFTNQHLPGQIAGCSSTEFGLANMIWAAVVMAKVREMKEQEATLKVKEEVEQKEKRKSFQG